MSTTTFWLVRHAAHDDVGQYLAGRKPGVTLGPEGRAQAERLGRRMARESIALVVASPRERAQETADAIVAATGAAPAEVSDALDEVDFGAWTGKTFEALEDDAEWRRWNTLRSLARAPGGETMLEVQRRVTDLMQDLCRRVGEGGAVLVSHGDVIKAAVCHVLGLQIDAWPRFDIAPASITTIVLGDWGGKVLTLNETTP